MAISSVSNTSTLDIIYNTTNTSNAPAVDKSSTNSDSQPSTVVTLSAQAQQLSRTPGQAQIPSQPVPGQNAESATKESAETPKTQSAEGESAGRSISVYA